MLTFSEVFKTSLTSWSSFNTLSHPSHTLLHMANRSKSTTTPTKSNAHVACQFKCHAREAYTSCEYIHLVLLKRSSTWLHHSQLRVLTSPLFSSHLHFRVLKFYQSISQCSGSRISTYWEKCHHSVCVEIAATVGISHDKKLDWRIDRTDFCQKTGLVVNS